VRRRLLVLLALAAAVPACATTGEPLHDRSVAAVIVDANGVTQTFIPRGNHFSVFEVRTATYGAPGPADGTLELVVSDGATVRRAAVGAGAIGDNTTVRFRFEPYPEAAGQQFSATVTWTGSTALALWTNPNDAYLDGWLEPGGGDLVFAIGHAGRLRGAVEAAGRVGDEALDNLRDEPVLTSGWLLGLGALGVVAVRRPRAVGLGAGRPRATGPGVAGGGDRDGEGGDDEA